VFGRAKVDGRTAVVVGDDFNRARRLCGRLDLGQAVDGGEMAHDFRLPIIRIIEGSGGGGSVKTIETKGAANLPGGIAARAGIAL